jgi:hypothetical protein
MVAAAHLIAEFFLRIALDVHLTAKSPLYLAKHRKQLSRCNVTNDEKIDVARGSLLAASNRSVNPAPADFVVEPC